MCPVKVRITCPRWEDSVVCHTFLEPGKKRVPVSPLTPDSAADGTVQCESAVVTLPHSNSWMIAPTRTHTLEYHEDLLRLNTLFAEAAVVEYPECFIERWKRQKSLQVSAFRSTQYDISDGKWQQTFFLFCR